MPSTLHFTIADAESSPRSLLLAVGVSRHVDEDCDSKAVSDQAKKMSQEQRQPDRCLRSSLSDARPTSSLLVRITQHPSRSSCLNCASTSASVRPSVRELCLLSQLSSAALTESLVSALRSISHFPRVRMTAQGTAIFNIWQVLIAKAYLIN